ncbi:aryl-sulfate sulfotransferase [bacterium]|nr:aryl-sulfate sulfotransferase [bacterium]
MSRFIHFFRNGTLWFIAGLLIVRIFSGTGDPFAKKLHAQVKVIQGVSVPGDFPHFSYSSFWDTAPGRLFFASTFSNAGNYIVILNNDGSPYYYRRFEKSYHGTEHFELQPNGMLSFYSFADNAVYVMNPHFELVDTLTCTPEYVLDTHEFLYLENNHKMLIARDPRHVNMSGIVTNGKEKALILGEHIQEFDGDGNLVFDWSSWDHLDITDCLQDVLAAPSVNLVNFNSLAVDYDGHIILSIRNFNQVIKIHRQTGEILWRLGGIRNEFTFINDPEQFAFQHDARPVPGKPGHYTLFDNGQGKVQEYSRAVEYVLDLDRMTAEKVWEFRPVPDRFCFMMGSVQVLPNGNRLVDMSLFPPLYSVEVSESGEILSTLDVKETSTYRTRKYEFDGKADIPYLVAEPHRTRVTLIFNKFGDTQVSAYKVYGDVKPEPVRLLCTAGVPYAELLDLPDKTTFYFRVTAVDGSGRESGYSNTEKVDVDFYGAGENMLQNGDFSDNRTGWSIITGNDAAAFPSTRNDMLQCRIRETGQVAQDIRCAQDGLELIKELSYELTFGARTDNERTIRVSLTPSDSIAPVYAQFENVRLNKEMHDFHFAFTMKHQNDYNARLSFDCGGETGDVCLDNIFLSLTSATHVQTGPKPEPDFRLMPNFPNPFNTGTAVRFTMKRSGHVMIRIFNMGGQEVEQICDRNMEAGQHSLTWNAASWPSGTYIIHVRIDGHARMQKCVLMK